VGPIAATPNSTPMAQIRRGLSRHPDPVLAARELADQLYGPDTGAVIFFCSAAYDLERLECALADRFAGTQVLGCTTAGEISLDGYTQRALVGMSFPRSEFLVVADRCEHLATRSLLSVCATVGALLKRLRTQAPGAKAGNTFAVLLIDGLAGLEEPILSAIVRELGDIPLVGGSAGDNLRFKETVVFHEDTFYAESAVLALVHTERPFEVFKTQHIRSLDTKMVITEADPVRRVVTEINAEPASIEYARLAGAGIEPLAPMQLATHPLTVRVGGDDYVRSIRSVNEDSSLTFYCAIDEGIVLSAGTGVDLIRDLDRLFARIENAVGPPAAVLGFDCIFRRLELQTRGMERRVSGMLAANNVVGFSTYGEQFQAMHLNQTFSGIAFGSDLRR
jgi:hypothetical protein